MATDPKKFDDIKDENLDEVAGGRTQPIAADDDNEQDAGGSTNRFKV